MSQVLNIIVITIITITNINAEVKVGLSLTTSTANIEQHPNINLLDFQKCGPLISERISNGDGTKLGEFPWMALLEYETGTTIKFLCGGTLVNKNYVLTAAHCVFLKYQLISVRLGEYDINTDPDCVTIEGEEICAEPVQNIPVDRNAIVYHHKYNKPKLANDIALIRLSRPANLSSESVTPVCLPATEALRSRDLSNLIVTGWGLNEKGIPSNVLLKATISTISRDMCQKDFEKLFIQEEDICAVSQNASNSCSGDSGGPLQFAAKIDGKSKQPKYVQFGIVAFGKSSCGNRAYVNAIYTRVSSYMNWILDNMQS